MNSKFITFACKCITSKVDLFQQFEFVVEVYSINFYKDKITCHYITSNTLVLLFYFFKLQVKKIGFFLFYSCVVKKNSKNPDCNFKLIHLFFL